MPRRGEPNPNQKTMRVHKDTLVEIKRLARKHEISVPDLIDTMVSTFKLINSTIERKDGDSARVDN